MAKLKLPPVLSRKDFDNDEEYALYRSAEAGEWVSSGDIEYHRERWKTSAISTVSDMRLQLFSPNRTISLNSNVIFPGQNQAGTELRESALLGEV